MHYTVHKCLAVLVIKHTYGFNYLDWARKLDGLCIVYKALLLESLPSCFEILNVDLMIAKYFCSEHIAKYFYSEHIIHTWALSKAMVVLIDQGNFPELISRAF